MGFVLATFNVLDLFDATDPARIERLAAILRPHAPDVVALQELGSYDAARAFGEALGGGYTAMLGDADARGIRCGVLTRFPAVESNVARAESLPFPRFYREDPAPFGSRIPLRRAIPDVVVDAGELGRVRVLVVHFKSRRAKGMRDRDESEIAPVTTADFGEGEARAVTLRAAEALFVRRIVDDRLARNPEEKLVVCGDFNDVAGSLPLRIVCGVAGADEARSDALVSCAERIALQERVSVLHDGEPAAIDHALLSATLAAPLERCFYERSALTPEGPSDHAPLVVRFAYPE